MGFSFKGISPDFTQDYITVKTAAENSGYSQQYLRRLLRAGYIKTKKIGQQWLIDQSHFIEFLSMVEQNKDKRYGPR